MSIKYIFVDIDNTILDFDAYVKQTMRVGFEQFGITPYEPWMYDVFHAENTKLWEQIERQEITFEGLKKVRWNIIFGKLGIDFDGPTFETYFRKALFDCAIPVDGAYELLDGLHDKYVLCTASNGPFEQQMNRLSIAKMKDYFSYHFISQQIGVAKPAREFFEYAFDVIRQATGHEIKPEECLMIGDSMTSDMAGGIAYGMKTCLYDKQATETGNGAQSGYTEHSDFSKVDFVVKDLREILGILEENVALW